MFLGDPSTLVDPGASRDLQNCAVALDQVHMRPNRIQRSFQCTSVDTTMHPTFTVAGVMFYHLSISFICHACSVDYFRSLPLPPPETCHFQEVAYEDIVDVYLMRLCA